MTAQELKLAQEAIEIEVFSIAQEQGLSNDEVNAITDGVCDFEAYLNSKPRVMWILKEAYDDNKSEKPQGGGWSIPNDSFKNESTLKVRTNQMVIYTMYGYKHNISYADLPTIANKPEMGNVLKEICWINLSKMPGKSQSSDKSYINSYLEYWRPIIKKQIEVYDPEVIIFGGSLDDRIIYDFLQKKDLDKGILTTVNGVNFYEYKSNGRLIISAYHPAFLGNGLKLETYSNHIMEVLHNYVLAK